MQDKTTKSGWKQKALDRQRQIRSLKKKLDRVLESRRRWRDKYYQLKRQSKAVLGTKPQGYWYTTALVWLCVSVYYNSVCSLRSLSEMVVAVGLMLHLRLRKPCAATVRGWINKYGYYCYSVKQSCAAVSKKGPWAVIVDESVAIGQERLLVVLGVPLAEATFQTPLTYTDVTVLFLSVQASWKGEQIAQALRQIAKHYPVPYCISDKGNNIMAALREVGWYHVYDCSHLWAWAVESVYKEDKDFQQLFWDLNGLRKRWILSKQAHLMPPAQRSKARFVNCFDQVAWIEKMQGRLEDLDEGIQKALCFFNTHETLIKELCMLKDVLEQMAGLLKAKGLNSENLQTCRSLMAPLKKGRLLDFRERVLAEWQKHTSRLQKGETLLCCSDIVESCFGRLKCGVKINASQSLTESVLSLCGYTNTVTQHSVEEALNKVHVKDLKEWKQQNTIPSLQQKRRAFFDKNCPKLPRAA